MHCNRNKLAKVLGRDVKTIDRMVEKGMPYLSRPDTKLGQTKRLFDTGEVLAWMIGDSSAATLKDATTRLAQAKAGLKWLAYGQALGYLVDVEEVLRRSREATPSSNRD